MPGGFGEVQPLKASGPTVWAEDRVATVVLAEEESAVAESAVVEEESAVVESAVAAEVAVRAAVDLSERQRPNECLLRYSIGCL